MFDWDADKATANFAKHGVASEAADGFDFATCVEHVDDRVRYGEDRIAAIGFIGPRLHVLIYTIRNGHMRIISLRRANARERRDYEQAKA